MSLDFDIVFHAVQSVMSFFIIGCIGYFLAKRGWFSDDSTLLISKLLTLVALPIYLLYNINTSMTKEQLLGMVYGTALPFTSILIVFGLSILTERLWPVPRNRRGIFFSSCSFSNTIYIGLPVNLALFGESALPYVLLYYFANTSMLWSVGNYCLASDGDGARTRILSLSTLKKIFSPPLIGFLIGMCLLLMNIKLPTVLATTARHLGGMTTPLVIIVLGVMIQNMGLSKIRFNRELALIMLYRFVVSPLLIIALAHFFPLPELMLKVFIIQSSLPVISSLALLLKYYNSDYDFATIVVSATTLASLVTIPVYMVVASHM